MGMADYCETCDRVGICVCSIVTANPELDARDTALGILEAAICQIIADHDPGASLPGAATRLLNARDYILRTSCYGP